MQAGADQDARHAEDLRGVGEQVRLGQVAVPVVRGLREGVLDAGLACTRYGLSCGIPTAWAIVSAVLNPIPHTSAANRYGSCRFPGRSERQYPS
jgi:hypothetical protein